MWTMYVHTQTSRYTRVSLTYTPLERKSVREAPNGAPCDARVEENRRIAYTRPVFF